MNETSNPDLASFRNMAIRELDNLRKRYLKVVRSKKEDEDSNKVSRLEKAVRLLPGLVKTEESLLSSVEKAEQRKRLEEDLEPLFKVLHKVLDGDFDRKREDILEALEAELKSDGS